MPTGQGLGAICNLDRVVVIVRLPAVNQFSEEAVLQQALLPAPSPAEIQQSL